MHFHSLRFMAIYLQLYDTKPDTLFLIDDILYFSEMKRILIAVIIVLGCLPLASRAQNKTVPVTLLTKDSVRAGFTFAENWLLSEEDNIVFADPGYDDSRWKLVYDSKLKIQPNKKDSYLFKGKAWLRLHIYIDSSVKIRDFAFTLKHLGASEVYIDGKKTASFGAIKEKNNSEYYNPNSVPFIEHLDTGAHVIAVRYANYDAQKNFKTYEYEIAGFTLSMAEADNLVENFFFTSILSTSIIIFCFTFFFAFSLIHLVLFLYNRKEKANLYFSIFCFCFGCMFLAPFVRSSLSNPFAALNTNNILIIAATATCMSLSGFLNELFGKKKLRFYIIVAVSMVVILLWFIDHILGAVFCFGLMISVCIEAIILIFIALYRRVKGAFIVGIGILSLCFSILGIIAIGIFYNASVNMDNGWGIMIVVFIFSIPVSMSVYLSWNYSRINKDLAIQLQHIETLSEKTLQQELEKQRMLENRQEELEQEVELRTAEIKNEKKKSDDLLRNILPEEVAEELKQKGSTEAKYFDHVSVIFTDFVNFTKAGERMTPQELVNELHTCFKAFDEICSKYGIEKIKTIGDAYLAVCGLPMSDPNHAINTTKAAIEIREFIAVRKQQLPDKSFHIRIGIHSGAVVAGIVGVKKFAYDIWGDTVNTAARMEQHGESGKINISENTYELIKDLFNCTFRGQITAKNKGELNMYFVNGEK